MADLFLVWLSAGVLAAGVSAATIAGAGLAAAEDGAATRADGKIASESSNTVDAEPDSNDEKAGADTKQDDATDDSGVDVTDPVDDADAEEDATEPDAADDNEATEEGEATDEAATDDKIASVHGEIELPVIVTKDIVAGVVAVPHGWGHKGTAGWRVANGAGGANVNRLMSSAPEDIERLAGMARLTGVPVRVERGTS